MRKFMTSLWATAMLVTAPAFAQTEEVPEPVLETINAISMGHFWTAVFVGLILAMGLQFIMTAITAATGLSLAPDLKKEYARFKAKVQTRGDQDRFHHHDDDDDYEDDEDYHEKGSALATGVNYIGMWVAATTSITLFLASFMAIKVGLLVIMTHAVVAALVIWALFFIMVSVFEYKTARSFLGGIASIAGTGLSAGSSALSSIFSHSPSSEIEKATRKSVRAMYEELAHINHKDNLDKKFRKYVQEIAPDDFDYKQLHDDVYDLLSQIKVEENFDVDEEHVSRILHLKLEKDHKHMTPENAARLNDTVHRAATAAKSQRRNSDKAITAAEIFAPLPDEDARALRQKLETTLANSGRSEVDPAALRADIEKIIDDPKHGTDVIKERAALFNRDTVKALLAQHRDLDERKADTIVETVLSAVDGVRSKYGVASQDAAGKRDQVKDLPANIEARIADYFDNLDRPELSYGQVRMDIEHILSEPTSAPGVVYRRFKQMDEGTLYALLRSNPNIEDERARHIAHSITQKKDGILRAVRELHDEALSRYERMQRRAVIAADHARIAATSAAVWVMVTGVLSAVTAVLGAWLGLISI
jgi:FtsH-binding integral membrane protein